MAAEVEWRSWTPGPVIAGTESEMTRRIMKCQQLVKADIKRSINVGNRDGKHPSAPGTPPRKVSSQLFQSIAAPAPEKVKGEIRGLVGSNKEYARRLEKGFVGTDARGRNVNQAPRPYIIPAFYRNIREIAAILSATTAPPSGRASGGGGGLL